MSGLSFVVIFSVFQVSTITCLFMIVNTPYSTLYSTGWQKYSIALCYFIFSIYYASTLYYITITAENAFNNLKHLSNQLRQKQGKRKSSLHSVIKSALSFSWRAGKSNSAGYWSAAKRAWQHWTSVRQWILRDQQRHSHQHYWNQCHLLHHSAAVQSGRIKKNKYFYKYKLTLICLETSWVSEWACVSVLAWVNRSTQNRVVPNLFQAILGLRDANQLTLNYHLHYL